MFKQELDLLVDDSIYGPIITRAWYAFLYYVGAPN